MFQKSTSITIRRRRIFEIKIFQPNILVAIVIETIFDRSESNTTRHQMPNITHRVGDLHKENNPRWVS